MYNFYLHMFALCIWIRFISFFFLFSFYLLSPFRFDCFLNLSFTFSYVVCTIAANNRAILYVSWSDWLIHILRFQTIIYLLAFSAVKSFIIRRKKIRHSQKYIFHLQLMFENTKAWARSMWFSSHFVVTPLLISLWHRFHFRLK